MEEKRKDLCRPFYRSLDFGTHIIYLYNFTIEEDDNTSGESDDDTIWMARKETPHPIEFVDMNFFACSVLMLLVEHITRARIVVLAIVVLAIPQGKIVNVV